MNFESPASVQRAEALGVPLEIRTLKTATVTMPGFLASALVNGDTSGLECSCGAEEKGLRAKDPQPEHTGKCDFRWLKEALDYCAPGHIVSTADQECDCADDLDKTLSEEDPDYEIDHTDECASHESAEASFAWYCDLPGWGRFGADMIDYVVLYPDQPEGAGEKATD